jgi:hypothetical protein
MQYHVNFMGKDLGVVELDELRQRRKRGELTGQELVWCQGMPGWQALDVVLGSSQAQPGLQPKRPMNRWVLVAIVVGGVIFLSGVVVTVVALNTIGRRLMPGITEVSRLATGAPDTAGVDVASQPLPVTGHDVTWKDVRARRKALRVREYVDAYRTQGPRGQPWDADAQRMLDSWLEAEYGDGTRTNLPNVVALGDSLAANPGCDDPIVLTIAGSTCVDWFEAKHRLQRALAAFDNSGYNAYPKLYATVMLAAHERDDPATEERLDNAAVKLFRHALSDGSLRPEDQADIAESLVNGWGKSFFERRGEGLCNEADQAGPDFRWLALTLKGEYEINEAWKARGSGWADSVRQQGWQAFADHLSQARTSLTAAWKLQPDLPLAPCLMETVALGNSGAQEMRQWFDRAVAAQVDYPGAWYSMRWGLYPRWYGSLEALRTFGVMGLNSGRFDTDIPHKFFDTVGVMESESNCLPGQHFYGRSDIWPDLQRMYEGYISNSVATSQDATGWRSSYAVVAYFAGRYDVARQQLETVNWSPPAWNLEGWGKDLSLTPLEVAARTGSLASQIDEAESARDQDAVAAALAMYQKLAALTNADAKTRLFVARRESSLAIENRLLTGQWIDFMPVTNDDQNWTVSGGLYQVFPDGAVEIRSSHTGFLLFSNVRVGVEFEIQGEFELVQSSTKDFQAGVMMGLPENSRTDWYGFRMKRNTHEGEVASFSIGWTARQVRKPVSLRDGWNTFHFRFNGVKADAWVNDNRILENTQTPGPVEVMDDQYLVGLDAFNDMNDTTLRYRSVKVRRLNTGNDAAAGK